MFTKLENWKFKIDFPRGKMLKKKIEKGFWASQKRHGFSKNMSLQINDFSRKNSKNI